MVRRSHLLWLLVLAGCGSRGLARDDAGGDSRGLAGSDGGDHAGSGAGGSAGSGAAGFAGSASGGFTGAAGGTGGGPIVNPCLPMPTAVNCGGGLCGNGVRDTCVIRAAFDACPEVRFTEVCDGTDFGAVSCKDLGYGGGTPMCSNFCQTIGSNGCQECHDLDARLLACGPAPITAKAVASAIGASDSEVALGWVEQDDLGQQALGFARLTPSLTRLTSARIELASGESAGGLSAAQLPSGWALVGVSLDQTSELRIFVHAFDAAGQHVSRTIVGVIPEDFGGGPPIVASRPDGGPLVLWRTERVIRAAVIAADGRSATAPVDVAQADLQGFSFSAAYVGGSFYVVDAVRLSDDTQQLRLTRIETDGRVGSTAAALPGVDAYSALLVPGANDLRLVYSGPLPSDPGADPASSLWWQRIGPTGAAAAAPVELSGWDARGVGFGSETVLLLSGVGFPPSIGFARIAMDGGFVETFRPIATSHELRDIWGLGLARRGPDVVVMWTSYAGGIRLARVTP